MARFFIAGTNFPNGRAIIRGRDADHIRVLRLRAGDDIVICDGAGRDYKCRLVQTLEHEAEAEVIEVVPCKAEPTVRSTVFAGLPKGERSDFLVQKCTEAGASEIVFFSCTRCVAKAVNMEKKLERWQRIAEEAAKLLATFDPADDVIVCTDLFGGSVNNEFTKIVQTRPNTYLVANMNLPLLIQLLFSDQEAPADQVIREILAADDTRVKFVNDLLTDADDEEEF